VFNLLKENLTSQKINVMKTNVMRNAALILSALFLSVPLVAQKKNQMHSIHSNLLLSSMLTLGTPQEPLSIILMTMVERQLSIMSLKRNHSGVRPKPINW
jgi:hypothetical protein